MQKRKTALLILFTAMMFSSYPPLAADPKGEPSERSAVVPILIYHSVREYRKKDSPSSRRYITTPESLEAELQFLKRKGYVSIGFDDLAAYLTNGRALPEPCVILSFDDGWKSQFKNAFPLLKKYGFRATFFVFTNAIGKKYFMNLEELMILRKSGMWIGSHSISHPFLTKMKNKTALYRQIYESKKILERKIGEPITVFAYPFGQYNNEIVTLVRESGYVAARGTYPGIMHTTGDLFTLTGIIDVVSPSRLEAALSQVLPKETYSSQTPPPGIDPSEYE